MRLCFVLKGKPQIEILSSKIIRRYKICCQFILNIYISKCLRSVHSCQSVYFNLFKIQKGTFEHFYLISSTLKNNAVRSFFYVFMSSFMVYNFWQRTHVFTVLMYFNTYEQMRYTRGKKSTHFTKEFNLYSFYTAQAAFHFSVNIHWIFSRSF